MSKRSMEVGGYSVMQMGKHAGEQHGVINWKEVCDFEQARKVRNDFAQPMGNLRTYVVDKNLAESAV